MTREEFIQKCTEYAKDFHIPTVNEYNTIKYVYVWHPCIDPVKGKEQIAKLYCEFGMTIIIDMLPRAQKVMTVEVEAARHKLRSLRQSYRKWRHHTDYEVFT